MNEFEAKNESTSQENRAHFLRRLGKLAAVGLGMALFTASSASAADACCRDDTCTNTCAQGYNKYRCYDSCINDECCVCLANTEPCRTVICRCR